MTVFDVEALRRQFPALRIEEDGRPVALFDGPGGTQVPESVIEAVLQALLEDPEAMAKAMGMLRPTR